VTNLVTKFILVLVKGRKNLKDFYMNIDYTIIAPLIRGLCINITGQAQVVISEKATTIPANALTVDLNTAWDNDDQIFDEEIAGKLFQEAYTAWEFDLAPSGVEAATQKIIRKKQPTCVAIINNQNLETLYWIDQDIDSAKNRSSSKNDLPFDDYSIRESENISVYHRNNIVKNKIALVTGGVQGFGEEIVRGLTSSGAIVYIADINYEDAQHLAGKINVKEHRTLAIAVQVDVSNEQSVKKMFETVIETTGGLDICISNAGVLKDGSVLDQDLESFEYVTSINYTGFFIVAKYCSRLLRCQNRTAPNWKTDIIQINSKSGLMGANKNSAYSGGKFGSIGLTASFALDLVDYNIKVNAICPGNFFNSPLWSDPEKGLFVQYLKSGKVLGARSITDIRNFYEDKIPMKRGCTGIDVMRAIYYIIEQEYETGQAIPVTGGEVMLH